MTGAHGETAGREFRTHRRSEANRIPCCSTLGAKQSLKCRRRKMSDTTAFRLRQNRRVTRRVFLYSTSVIPAALASPELLRPRAGTTTPRPDLEVGAVEPCESRLPIVGNVPLQPFVAQVTRLIAAAEYLGAPLPPAHQRELEAAFKMTNEESAVTSI